MGDERIELSTSSLSETRSTTELVARNKFILADMRSFFKKRGRANGARPYEDRHVATLPGTAVVAVVVGRGALATALHSLADENVHRLIADADVGDRSHLFAAAGAAVTSPLVTELTLLELLIGTMQPPLAHTSRPSYNRTLWSRPRSGQSPTRKSNAPPATIRQANSSVCPMPFMASSFSIS